MALPIAGGGFQVGTGNKNELNFTTQVTPATVAAGDATLTTAQLVTGLIIGSPGASAAAYTLPTGALMDAAFPNMRVDTAFNFHIINADGNTSGVITMTSGTGFTMDSSGSQGLMTIAAVAGTAAMFRARKTGEATWLLYRIAS